MKKAAMPIPYIIALILGVVVVALLAYWFISTGGKGGGVGKEAECRARVLDWCVTKGSEVRAEEACAGVEGLKKSDWVNNLCCKVIPNFKPGPGQECPKAQPQP